MEKGLEQAGLFLGPIWVSQDPGCVEVGEGEPVPPEK